MKLTDIQRWPEEYRGTIGPVEMRLYTVHGPVVVLVATHSSDLYIAPLGTDSRPPDIAWIRLATGL